MRGEIYTIFGYKGKQVRDNIHSYDAVRALEEFIKNPRAGEVYNLGGGRENSISILEALARLEEFTGRKVVRNYCEEPRKGDHVCYISNVTKLKSDYPGWQITRDLAGILKEMVAAEAGQKQAAI